MKITPKGKYILVLPEDDKTATSDFGLSIPDQVEQEKKAVGVVQEISKELFDVYTVGQKVVYGVYAGDQLQMKDGEGTTKTYLLIHDDDILAYVNE